MVTSFDILNQVPDPLFTGIAILRQSGIQLGSLQELLARHGGAPSAKALESVTRLARDIAQSKEIDALSLSSTLLQKTEPAGQWLAAAILERNRLFAEAATVYDSIPDAGWGEQRAMRLLACAQARIGAGQDPWLHLRHGIQCAESRKTLALADRLLSQAGPGPVRIRRRVALLGSGSLNFWAPVLRPIAFAAGIGLDLYVGQYDQYRQEVLDPGSPLEEFRPEIVILATDWRSTGLPEESASPKQAIQACLDELRKLWSAAASRWGATVIQHNFEVPEVSAWGNLSAVLPGGRARMLRELNLELASSGIPILDIDQIAGIHGKSRWSDPTEWTLSKQYPHPDAVPLLARHQTALLRALLGLTSKCAVLDLDNTLWGGTIGEDGLNGIRLGGGPEGEAYLAFQRYLLGLRERGIALAVCSKNNPEDAREPFRQHPEMILKLEHFAAFMANWDPKPDNVRAIAHDLNLGIESLVFIDDHPVERARLRAELPDVQVPEMPADASLYVQAVHRTLLFESVSLTSEDRLRAEAYQQNLERETLKSSSTNVEDFLADLKMRVELMPFDQPNLPRIVQLINKTNQFNLTTQRVTAPEVEAMLGDSGVFTRYLRLRDRFGDSGITGILIARREGGDYHIEHWLMSCRVLGRRLEDMMFTNLLRHATGDKVASIVGKYVPTAKNAQVAGLYEKLGFSAKQEPGLFTLRLSSLQPDALEYPSWAEVITS